MNTSYEGGKVPSLPEGFWQKVDVRGPDDCWEWTRAKSVQGYGHVHYQGKVAIAPRLVLALKMGRELDSDEETRHTCDNPPCVNPYHLVTGSKSDNQRDSVARGLWANGNLRKTHCKRNHEFTEENTRINPRGERVCRTCDRESQRKRRALE